MSDAKTPWDDVCQRLITVNDVEPEAAEYYAIDNWLYEYSPDIRNWYILASDKTKSDFISMIREAVQFGYEQGQAKAGITNNANLHNLSNDLEDAHKCLKSLRQQLAECGAEIERWKRGGDQQR